MVVQVFRALRVRPSAAAVEMLRITRHDVRLARYHAEYVTLSAAKGLASRSGCFALLSMTGAAICATFFAVGCQWPGVWPVAVGSNSTPQDTARAEANAPLGNPGGTVKPTDQVHVVHLAFDVSRAEMAIDGAMNSRKVWNYVDELRVGTEASAQLARNGLRLGVGGAGSWPAIAVILDACRAKRSRDQLLAQPGAPLLVELAELAESETVFAYGIDRRLTGKTFEEGSKVLQLDYAFHPHLNGATDVQVRFEIRKDRGELTWQRQVDGSIRQAPAIDRHVFDGLQARATIYSDEFLVIGPSEQAENEYIVGSRFLTRSEGGERYETLLFIAPQPFQSASVRQRR